MKKNDLAEMNLNTVLLINPKNEEAIFNLMKLQIKKSNFSELNKNFEIFKKKFVKTYVFDHLKFLKS